MKKSSLQVHLTFASIVSAQFAVFFGMNALKVALPTLLTEFNVTTASLAWVVVGYSLTYAAVLPVTGRLGDAFGHARIILAGIGIFAVGTLLSAFATGLPLLVVGRLVAGVGGGAIFPNVMVLSTRLYPPEARARTIGMVASVASISGVLGPGLGGLLMSAFGWRSIFYATLLLVPVAVYGVVHVMRTVDSGIKDGDARADEGSNTVWTSIVLLATVALLLLSVEHVQQLGTWPFSLLVPGFAVSALALYVVERRQGWQLLDFRLLKGPAIAHGMWSGIVHRAFIQVDGLVMPLFLALRLNLTEASLGAILLVGAAIRTVMAPIGGSFSDRFGRAVTLRIGFGAIAIGYALLSVANAKQSLPWTIGALAVSAVGGSGLAPSAWSLVLSGTPPERQGIVSGLYDTIRVVSAMTAVMIVSTGLQLEDGGRHGFQVVLLAMAGLMATASVVGWTIPKSVGRPTSSTGSKSPAAS